MDTVLTREEATELMALLNMPMTLWGNIPAIRKGFINACKHMHPDKGGNEEDMKKLNNLYQKMQRNLHRLNKETQNEELDDMQTWSSTEVQLFKYCHLGESAYFDGPVTVQDFYGQSLPSAACKDWDTCSKFDKVMCPCMLCILKRRHTYKSKKFRRPMYWGRCWCFYCFCVWFGVPDNYEAFYWYMALMKDMYYDDIRWW